MISKETNYLKDDGNVVFDSFDNTQSPKAATTIINVSEVEKELRSPNSNPPQVICDASLGYNLVSSDINFGNMQ